MQGVFMKIAKIRYAEYGRGGNPFVFEIEGADLTVEEYADVRFLVDLSKIIENKLPYVRPEKNQPGLFIIVETDSTIHACHFLGNPPEEVKQLAERLKEIQQNHPQIMSKSA